MSEPESIKEYIESLRPLPVHHLECMAAHVDKERFPERYKAIMDVISEKKLHAQNEGAGVKGGLGWDYEPEYPAYTLGEFLDAREYLDRKNYPERESGMGSDLNIDI